ncbi:hypothetical protein Pcinc_019334 [Petrolisthes cinctipes]|uniref:Tc1-like transposase DDE domain-containing protein n=1 Tax=Petrolisthes cinctipes TaxID=88211 RepID=A0AAE1KKJ4_PETCI|nr:hypothetical protein Pcinc_019334 [Petrolisthes cinctipes]
METRQRRAVERGRIIGMREAGYSISDISRDLGLTRQTVQRWLTRWEESGNLEDRPRVVQRWFEERREQIELLPWPALSPDLNPIENVWAQIVNAWEPENERTRAHLLQPTKDMWERFGQNIYNIVSSAPDRLQAVIEADGHWTAY